MRGAAEGVLVGSGERAGLEALEDGCEGISFVVNALLDELVVAAGRWRSPSSLAGGAPPGETANPVLTEDADKVAIGELTIGCSDCPAPAPRSVAHASVPPRTRTIAATPQTGAALCATATVAGA